VSGHPGKRQDGFSLVGVMVALVVSLILMLAVYGVYMASTKAYDLERGRAQVQDNGRFAMALLDPMLRMAGYTGCGGHNAKVTNVLNNASTFNYDFSKGVQGYGYNASNGGWTPAEPSVLSSLSRPPVTGSDIIAITAIKENGQYITSDMPRTSADLKVNPVNPPKVHVGEIMVISDCSSASIFQVTNYTTSNGNVVHNAGGSYTPGNATKNLGSAFHAGAHLQKIVHVTYFIASRSGATNCDANDCGLYRYSGGSETELVGGVENMQLRYGVDTSGDQVPNRYVDASAVTDWHRVVSMELALLAYSRTKALPNTSVSPSRMKLLDQYVNVPSDRRLRRVFTGFIAIRNREK